jgi:hypothetical protein
MSMVVSVSVTQSSLKKKNFADRATGILQGLRNADTDAGRVRKKQECAEDKRRDRP